MNRFSRIIVILIVISMSVVFLSCNKSDNAPEDEQEEVLLNTDATKLGEGDINESLEDYNQVLQNEPANSEALFGRALAKIILLGTRPPSSNVLAAFRQAPWLTSTVFTENGYLYTDNPTNLPFHDFGECYSAAVRRYFDASWKRSAFGCLLGNAEEGSTVSDVIGFFVQLEPFIDDIITDLIAAIEDASATYTIPRALYNGDADIHINHADMVQILAAMYGVKAGIDIAASWDFNPALNAFFREDGSSRMSQNELLDLLNSSFGLKANNRVVEARDNLYQFFTYSRQAMEEVLSGAQNGIFNLTDEARSAYEALSAFAEFGISSMDNGSVAVPNIAPAIIDVNLRQFFTNPPDANLIESDPFVVENFHIRAVEAFWQQMVSGICNIDLESLPNVRLISYPYSKIFGEIIGHRFGVNHYAGTPAN